MSEFLDNLNYDEFTSAEFEHWAKSEGYSLKIMDSGWAKGKYSSTEIRMLWKTWQASRESYSTVALMGAEIKRLELVKSALEGEIEHLKDNAYGETK